MLEVVFIERKVWLEETHALWRPNVADEIDSFLLPIKSPRKHRRQDHDDEAIRDVDDPA